MLKMLRILFIGIGTILVMDGAIFIINGKINFGTVVPVAIGSIFIAHGVFWQPIRQFVTRSRGLNRLWYGLWAGFMLWLISFAVFIGVLQQQIKQSRYSPEQVAAIIVLGSGTTHGQPTPTLARRLDAAVPMIKSHPQAPVITSGGVDYGLDYSEAEVMANYLHEKHGIALGHVLQEGKSTSTEENLLFSQPILASNGVLLSAPIAIVTSDFHIIRSVAIACRQGYLNPIAVPSPTPLSIRYNAWFREYFAFISGWLLSEY